MARVRNALHDGGPIAHAVLLNCGNKQCILFRRPWELLGLLPTGGEMLKPIVATLDLAICYSLPDFEVSRRTGAGNWKQEVDIANLLRWPKS